jgi:hypothetical protein
MKEPMLEEDAQLLEMLKQQTANELDADIGCLQVLARAITAQNKTYRWMNVSDLYQIAEKAKVEHRGQVLDYMQLQTVLRRFYPETSRMLLGAFDLMRRTNLRTGKIEYCVVPNLEHLIRLAVLKQAQAEIGMHQFEIYEPAK